MVLGAYIIFVSNAYKEKNTKFITLFVKIKSSDDKAFDLKFL